MSWRAGRRSTTRAAAVLVVLAAGQTLASTPRSAAADSPSTESVDAQVLGGHSNPRKAEVEAHLGAWAAGRETLTLRWREGALVLDLDRISVPGDGRWHETVPTFAVRHRVGWLAARGVLTLEEQHSEGARWRYELRFRQNRLDKIQPSAANGGEEVLVRTYLRRPRAVGLENG